MARASRAQCSRWDELKQTLLWHGRTAAGLGARTEFRLLNHPQGAPQRVVVGAPGVSDHGPSLAALDQVCAARPLMKTPLCAAVREVCSIFSPVRERSGDGGTRVDYCAGPVLFFFFCCCRACANAGIAVLSRLVWLLLSVSRCCRRRRRRRRRRHRDGGYRQLLA